jgi:hypothetical protein
LRKFRHWLILQRIAFLLCLFLFLFFRFLLLCCCWAVFCIFFGLKTELIFFRWIYFLLFHSFNYLFLYLFFLLLFLLFYLCGSFLLRLMRNSYSFFLYCIWLFSFVLATSCIQWNLLLFLLSLLFFYAFYLFCLWFFWTLLFDIYLCVYLSVLSFRILRLLFFNNYYLIWMVTFNNNLLSHLWCLLYKHIATS